MNHRISKLLALAIPALFLPVALHAQSRQDAVGVGVRVPTEDLHVKGRVRVESLPKTGTATSVYTKPDGTLSTGGRDQTFDADAHRVIQADANGVIGYSMAVKPLFFHMPCIVLPLETTSNYYNNTSGMFEINLYDRYVEQFTNPTGTPTPGSAAATRAVSPSAGALPVEHQQQRCTEISRDCRIGSHGIYVHGCDLQTEINALQDGSSGDRAFLLVDRPLLRYACRINAPKVNHHHALIDGPLPPDSHCFLFSNRFPS